MTRGEALALGLKRFDTGKPCPHGHPSLKYTSSASCVECVQIARDAKRNEQRSVKRLSKSMPEVSMPMVQFAIRTQPTSVWELAR